LVENKLDNSTWKKLNTYGIVPDSRSAHTSVLFENKMIIWGGQCGFGYLGDIYSINIGSINFVISY